MANSTYMWYQHLGKQDSGEVWEFAAGKCSQDEHFLIKLSINGQFDDIVFGNVVINIFEIF